MARRLQIASRTFFQLPWLVVEGPGAYDREEQKIPPYGVYVGIEAIIAEYLQETENRLLERPLDELLAPFKYYRDTLLEMRSGYEKWMA